MKRKSILIFSLFIPIAILLITSIFLKMYPFGNNSYIVSDMSNQYMDFIRYLKYIYMGENNFFYSFNSYMGANFIGLAAYYILSPLNLLTLFVSNNFLPVMIMIIIFIKIGLCGLTCNYYLSKQNEKHNITSLLFSTSFALMAYNVAYCYHVMWIDVVILTPLVLLGIDMIVDNKKPVLYIITLGLSLIFNYYIGYMLCLFSVIYFIYIYLLKCNSIKDLKIIINFIIASIIAVSLSAVVLIPTFMSLQGGKAVFSLDTILNFGIELNPMNIALKAYTGAYNWNDAINGYPNIFCGIFIVFLVGLYFFNKNIKLKERILSGSLIIILILIFIINSFNLIFHGFNYPNCFLYRESFIMSLIFIMLAYKCFNNIKSINKIGIILIPLLFIIYSTRLIINKPIFYSNNYMYILYFDLFIIIVYFLICLLNLRFDLKKFSIASVIILFTLHFSDLGLNAYKYLKETVDQVGSKYSSIIGSFSDNEYIVNKLKEEDNTFYRMENINRRTFNDSYFYNYNGITGFSSTININTRDFLEDLGFKVNQANVFYGNGSTKLIDSLLGIKYIINYGNNFRGYGLFYEDYLNVLKNPYALNIGYKVNSKILNYSIDPSNHNTFDIQNNMIKNMTNIDKDLFHPSNNYKIKTYNLEEFSGEYGINYKKIKLDDVGYLEYSISVDRTDDLYLELAVNQMPYVLTPGCNIYVNNELVGEYFNNYYWGPISLGKHNIGEKIIIRFETKESEEKIVFDSTRLYYEDEKIFNQIYAILNKEQVSIAKISSSHLIGTADIKENGYLMFTIPYDTGWIINVDDKKIEPIKIMNNLIGIKIDRGEHLIELKYIPKGFKLGLAITLSSIVLLLMYYIKK
ncbi:MAG: YfhO family protein [Bacilli bacterium]|nr:YfhO family protein [Bacilli bacterium]